MTTQQHNYSPEAKRLFKRSYSWFKRPRERAIQRLTELGMAADSVKVYSLSKRAGRLKSMIHRFPKSARLSAVVYVLICVGVMRLAAPETPVVVQEFWVAIGAVLSLALATACYLWLQSQLYGIVREMDCEAEVGLLGPLLEALWYTRNVRTRNLVYAAAMRLLPQVQPDGKNAIIKNYRSIVYSCLVFPNPKFALALLETLQRTEDVAGLPYIEQLATKSQYRSVQEAARNCYDHLLPFAQQKNSRETLLRAAAAAPTAPDVLLRPWQDVVITDPDQLLRAAGPQERLQADPDLLEASDVGAG